MSLDTTPTPPASPIGRPEAGDEPSAIAIAPDSHPLADAPASPQPPEACADVAPAPAPVRGWRAALGRLLALPLFYKVLIGNSAIVLVGAIAGTAITSRIVGDSGPGHGSYDLSLAIGFAVAGLALTFTLNALVLRAALSPLDRLRSVVERVQQGDVSVRARPSPLDDTQLRRLAETLNTMLDEVERYEEQVRALSGRLIYAQEDERQRIARELHDDTGQVLTLLLIRLKLLETQPGAEAIGAQLAELRGIVTGALDQVRRLALNLRPPTIDQLGLYPSLRSLVTTFTESTDIETSLRLPRARVTLTPERTLAVYRVVQEALTNVAKHAAAHTVTITVSADDDELRVQIADDGHGFIPDALMSRTRQRHAGGPGVGLFGMEERARLAGGSLRVRSTPGRGTIITLRAPLARGERSERASDAPAQASDEDAV
ncbi:MAG TPA: ATP-binding protein [Ktedonobacterales bacterium]|nr:ATP-binding protein [Ktedonobacterales bacterium]